MAGRFRFRMTKVQKVIAAAVRHATHWENGRTRRATRPSAALSIPRVRHRFALNLVDEAYALLASGLCRKVAVYFDEEIHIC